MTAIVTALCLMFAPAAPREASEPEHREVVEADGTGASLSTDEPASEPVAEAQPADDSAATPADAGESQWNPKHPKSMPMPPRPRRVTEPHPSVVGGYWDMDRTRAPEPKDGHDDIVAGSVLVPIGLIAAGSAAATVWLSAPGHCAERWAALDAAPTVEQCKGLRNLGIARVSYGSLMAISGAVLLGIGLHRREKHRRWQRGIALAPWFGARAGGLVYGGRFGGHRW